jgi:hypothetical protein
MYSSSLPFVLHPLPVPSSLTSSFQQHFARCTGYEAPHYAVFSSLILIHRSLVKIFSTLCTQIPSVYDLPLMSRDQVSRSYKTTGKIIFLCILVFTLFRQQTRRKRFWADW